MSLKNGAKHLNDTSIAASDLIDISHGCLPFSPTFWVIGIKHFLSTFGKIFALTREKYIENELAEVRNVCERTIEGTKLVSCVETMVRIEINRAGLRQLIVCLRFPQDYPRLPILLELKSKTLSDALLEKLASIAENEGKKLCQKPQVLSIIQYLKRFLDENPLCVVFDEITGIKKILSDKDKLKLQQRSSKIVVNCVEGRYFLNSKILIPVDYFFKPIIITEGETNFPGVLERFLIGQAHVILKQCTEPSATRLVKFKGGQERLIGGKNVKACTTGPTSFVACPSLEKVVKFWVKTVRELVKERCQYCGKHCLPTDPSKAQRDESADDHVERVYCGHLFHLQCLLAFMKTPPFKGGKKCPTCREFIAHDKWRLTERLAEDRWAHEQARQRELEEVAEFFE